VVAKLADGRFAILDQVFGEPAIAGGQAHSLTHNATMAPARLAAQEHTYTNRRRDDFADGIQVKTALGG
jgi:hypothetical protein